MHRGSIYVRLHVYACPFIHSKLLSDPTPPQPQVSNMHETDPNVCARMHADIVKTTTVSYLVLRMLFLLLSIPVVHRLPSAKFRWSLYMCSQQAVELARAEATRHAEENQERLLAEQVCLCVAVYDCVSVCLCAFVMLKYVLL